MQRVLAMAMGLLAVTLLLRWNEGRGQVTETNFPERGLDVVVSSRGTLLPARVVSGRTGLYETIVAGERILVEDATTAPGLRAACFGADFEIADAENFALHGDAGAGEAFEMWLAERPVPSICIVGTSGDLRPATEEASAAMDRALERLGATARPHHRAPTSWAYLGVRLEAGFVRLTEAYSEDSGVVMLFTVRPDLRSYADFEGEYAESHIWGSQEVVLERDVARGRILGEVRSQQESLKSVPRSGLAFDPPDGTPNPEGSPASSGGGGPEDGSASIAWESVYLGQKPFLVSHLAFPERPGVPTRSALCEVWIDGTKVAERQVEEGVGWKVWPLDLAAHAGSRVDLELRTRSRMAKGARTPVVIWGDAKLFWSGR